MAGLEQDVRTRKPPVGSGTPSVRIYGPFNGGAVAGLRWVTCPGPLPPRCSYGHAIIPPWFPDFRSRRCLAVHSTTHGHCISRWKMPPCLAEFDLADRRLSDAEASADLALQASRRSDRLDHLWRELRARVQFARWRPPAALAEHVAHVVEVRAATRCAGFTQGGLSHRCRTCAPGGTQPCTWRQYPAPSRRTLRPCPRRPIPSWPSGPCRPQLWIHRLRF